MHTSPLLLQHSFITVTATVGALSSLSCEPPTVTRLDTDNEGSSLRVQHLCSVSTVHLLSLGNLIVIKAAITTTTTLRPCHRRSIQTMLPLLLPTVWEWSCPDVVYCSNASLSSCWCLFFVLQNFIVLGLI